MSPAEVADDPLRRRKRLRIRMNRVVADPDRHVQCLLVQQRARVGGCMLTRNVQCDCVLGTDPLGIQRVVAFTAEPDDCRLAVLWALQVSDRIGTAASGAEPGAPATHHETRSAADARQIAAVPVPR